MTISPYTQHRTARDRGPQTSEDYNARLEENYRDLMYLYNAAGLARTDLDASFSALFKQIMAISSHVDQFNIRLEALEESNTALVFYSNEQIDNDRFNSTAYNIASVDRLTYHNSYGTLTLPHVLDSSLSKLRYTNPDGTYNVANGFEVLVAQIAGTADTGAAVVETSSPYDAMQGKPGRVWERNVIAATTHASGAQCYVYIRIPNELSITGTSNALSLVPFPVFNVDIMGIAYSTDPNVALTSTSTWTPFNEDDWYLNNSEAVGHIPPGAWAGDEALDAGPKVFYFEPKPITAIRLHLRQNSPYPRGAGSQVLYSYGLSDLDIRYDKFLSTGRAIIRLDAPGSDTINTITSVTPKAWNVAQSELDNVFSYRAIWETAYNSGSYTLTPVSASQRVWLEVTLNEVSPGYTPSLSSLVVNYT